MDNSYLLITLITFAVYIAFALAFLYLKRKLQKESKEPLRYILLIFSSFIIGIALLFYSLT